MRKIFEDFFDSENIYIRSEISADALHIIQPHLMPQGVKSAVVWLMPYYTGEHPERNISLYAVSKDYHIYAKALGQRLCSVAKEYFPNEEFYCFCDSSPINEVAAAIKAGLGVLGRNRLLINEKYGSFVFIGCLLTTMEAEKNVNVPLKHCAECGKCVNTCEFLAGKRDYCMSDLNQKKTLNENELAAVKAEKIRWGCDKCQTVCPMNEGVPETPIDFFKEEQIECVSADLIEGMTKEEFRKRAYSWRGKKTVLRNL